jgi:uncharacterized Zn finger protein (UPF0148 family)
MTGKISVALANPGIKVLEVLQIHCPRCKRNYDFAYGKNGLFFCPVCRASGTWSRLDLI